MNTNTNNKSICTVTELAKKLGLSRARFYQLQKTGIFPPPLYCIYTRRPFYPTSLQEKCHDIRKTGIGNNGHLIIFYTKCDAGTVKLKKCSKPKIRELSSSLKQMGLKISPSRAGKALKALYPDNWKVLEINGEIIAKVFRYFKNGV